MNINLLVRDPDHVSKFSAALSIMNAVIACAVILLLAVRLTQPHQRWVSLDTATAAFWHGGPLVLVLSLIALGSGYVTRSKPRGRLAVLISLITLAAIGVFVLTVAVLASH